MELISNLLELDGNLLLWIQEFLRQEWMTPFWKGITFLGNAGWFWIALSILLLLPKKTRKLGIAGLIALAIGALITNVALKNLVARTRPYEVVEGLTLLVGKQSDFSFPSGHSCASFAAATAYYKMAPKGHRKWGVLALVLAGLIAFSRLYVGVHYPTDVIAGIAIGVISGILAWMILKKIDEIMDKKIEKRES